MKIAKIFASVFAAVGAALMVAAVALCLFSLDAPVELVGMPKDAMACAEEMMESLAEGDIGAAAGYLYGQPDLGADTIPSDPMTAMVWDAFRESISYEFVGVCYAEDSGIYRDASVTALDISSVTANLQNRAHALLTAQVEAAEDMAALYDENNNFREDLVAQVLQEALEAALREDAKTLTRDVTLKLIHRDGQWWVVPDQALLQLLTGNVA